MITVGPSPMDWSAQALLLDLPVSLWLVTSKDFDIFPNIYIYIQVIYLFLKKDTQNWNWEFSTRKILTQCNPKTWSWPLCLEKHPGDG